MCVCGWVYALACNVFVCLCVCMLEHTHTHTHTHTHIHRHAEAREILKVAKELFDADLIDEWDFKKVKADVVASLSSVHAEMGTATSPPQDLQPAVYRDGKMSLCDVTFGGDDGSRDRAPSCLSISPAAEAQLQVAKKNANDTKTAPDRIEASVDQLFSIEASAITCRGDQEQLENACRLNRDEEMSSAADDSQTVSHLLSHLSSAPVSESLKSRLKSHLLSELTALQAQQEVQEKLLRITETSLERRQRSMVQQEEHERAKLELSARFKAEEEKRMEKRVRELMEEAAKLKAEEDKRMRQLEEQEEERRREEMEQERHIKEQENELIREKQKLEALARINTAASHSPGGTIATRRSPRRGDMSASSSPDNSLMVQRSMETESREDSRHTFSNVLAMCLYI